MNVTVAVEESSEAIDRQWDELCERTDAPPFLRPGWFACWIDSFGSGRSRILTARDGEALVGALPLQERGRVVGSPSNWHSPEFGAVATDDAAREALVAKLFSLQARRYTVGFVDSGDPLIAAWHTGATSTGYKTITRVLESSPYVDASKPWDAYEASLAKKLRAELRRRRKRLEEQGTVRLVVSTGEDSLEDELAEGFRIEEAAWKGSRGTAITSDAATETFYRNVSKWGAGRGWLRLAFLRLDEKNLAFDLCFEANGVHYLLKTGYEPAFSKLAPGMLMRYEMLQRAFTKGLRSYEFLGSNNPWKMQWTQAVRDRLLLQAFAPSLGGRLDWAAWAHGRPLAKKIANTVRRKR